ncbi:MAG: molecular chaperone TorD family protein [Anaerolineae bacterium]
MNLNREQREELLALADLYAGLAEALATDKSLPDWLGRPGREWPLWEPASHLAARFNWPTLSAAVEAMSEVTCVSPAIRQSAYERLMTAGGHTPIMLYESQHLNGRFLGPETFALKALYREAGLEIAGAELPDYAAVELDFLAFLAEQEAAAALDGRSWRQVRRLFIKEHAGRWLPQVGRQLAASNDPAWAAVGKLLTASLNPPRKRRRTQSLQSGLPRITKVETCNLCSFCVQVCPTHALSMREDTRMTRLVLQPSLCTHCRKCERVCEERALDMLGDPVEDGIVILRESPRATCPRCGKPTVSQAEITAMVARLGEHPAWLDYCLDCR